MKISELKHGQRFTIKNYKGVFVRVVKKSLGKCVYHKEDTDDLLMFMDANVLEIVK